jgi:hypothetical protein
LKFFFFFLVKRVLGWGPEWREPNRAVLCLLIVIILISYIIIYNHSIINYVQPIQPKTETEHYINCFAFFNLNQPTVSLGHRHLSNIDCLTFVMCPLLAPVLIVNRLLFFFFCCGRLQNYWSKQNRQYTPLSSLYLLDVYGPSKIRKLIDICGFQIWTINLLTFEWANPLLTSRVGAARLTSPQPGDNVIKLFTSVIIF